MTDFSLGQVREKRRIPLKKAESQAEKFYVKLEPYCDFIMLVGSIRRRRPEVGDIEFVALPRNLEEFMNILGEMGFLGGSRKVTFVPRRKDLVKVEVYIARKPEEVGAMVFTYTGDWLFNVAMRSIAKRRGWKLDQYGIQDVATGDWILQSPFEEDFFGALGVDYHDPIDRSFAHRKRGQKPSMGAITPRDWSPRRQIPGEEKYRETLGKVGWDGREWREPDDKGEFTWIWYGPGGKEGEHATQIERSLDGWDVWEYVYVEDQPGPDRFLKTYAWVPDRMLVEALYRTRGEVFDVEEIEEDFWSWARFAVGLGVSVIGYFGGQEEWVDSLP